MTVRQWLAEVFGPRHSAVGPLHAQPGELGRGAAIGLLVVLAAFFFLLRLWSPSELMDNDQERPAAYAMDIVLNGNWIVQRDQTGDIQSKPPLSSWIIASTAKALGGLNDFTLYLPSALATLGMALLVLLAGERLLGRPTALIAALLFLFSPSAFKMILLARTDPFFAFFVALAMFVAWGALRGRVSWLWFWAVALAATLTKGPLGVALGAMGCLAVLLEWRRADRATPLRVAPLLQVLGFVLFLAIGLGWFWLAIEARGPAVVDKMIGRELVGHAVGEVSGRFPGQTFFVPPLYFLIRTAPWGILTYIALWRVLRFPAADPRERLVGRYLACAFLGGLAIFCLAPSQRPDHLLPLVPVAALLAAMELRRWWLPRPTPHLVAAVGGLAIIVAAVYTVHNRLIKRHEDKIVRMAETSAMAQHLGEVGARDLPLLFVDAPYALQFRLGTMRQNIAMEWAREALASDYAAWVAVRRFTQLHDENGELPDGLYILDEARLRGRPFLRIISNRPDYTPSDKAIAFAAGVAIRMDGWRLDHGPEERPTLRQTRPEASLELENKSDQPVVLVLTRVLLDGSTETETIEFAPGARLTWGLGGAVETVS